jgi:hypothetical protein
MLQVWNELFETAMQFGRHYGPLVALGVVLFIAGAVGLRFGLRLLGRAVSRPPS